MSTNGCAKKITSGTLIPIGLVATILVLAITSAVSLANDRAKFQERLSLHEQTIATLSEAIREDRETRRKIWEEVRFVREAVIEIKAAVKGRVP